MKMRLEHDGFTGELLAFLRDEGCIAYYASATGAIEAIAPVGCEILAQATEIVHLPG